MIPEDDIYIYIYIYMHKSIFSPQCMGDTGGLTV
jgi:hypothetical protein